MIDDAIKKETEKLSRLIRGYEDACNAELDGDYKAAYESLVSAIMPIEAMDQYNWGVIYLNGQGVEKNSKKAYEWFRKASDKGYDEATRIIGAMYYNGEYVEKSFEKAFQYTMKAAEADNAGAMALLGSMYLHGEGVEKNYESGVQWLKKAALSGNKTCRGWLGQEYYRGTTLQRSYDKAWQWLKNFDANWVTRRSCDEEKNIYRPTNCILGMMYLHGKGVARDDKKAQVCLRYAAENGNDEAQFWLGFQYVRGLGVDIDIQEGDKWLKESAKNGFEDAVKLQQATQKREFLDAIWAKAKEEAEQDRRNHALAQMKSDLI